MRVLIWVMSLVCVGLSCRLCAAEVSRASIYYYSWDVQTVVSLSVDDVRGEPYIRIEIIDATEAAQFARWLKARPFSKVSKKHSNDVRLVVDLVMSDGVVETLYATKFEIYANDGKTSSPLDDDFKGRFRLWRK